MRALVRHLPRIRPARVVWACALMVAIGSLAATSPAQARPAGSPSALDTSQRAGITTAAGKPRLAIPFTFNGCDAGYFCVTPVPWNGAAQGYWPISMKNYILAGGTYFFPWGSCNPAEPGCNRGIHAWVNNTGYRVWLEQTPNGGNELCISNHGYNYNYNGVNDNDYWIYVSDNPNPC